MPAPLVYGIIYATQSKILRRIVVPSDNSSLNFLATMVGPGESIVARPTGHGDGHAQWAAAVQSVTGVMPPSAACAVVDATNTVILIVMADPALDTHPQGTLIWCYAPGIGIGATYDSTTGLFTAPAISRPAKGDVPAISVPPTVIPKP